MRFDLCHPYIIERQSVASDNIIRTKMMSLCTWKMLLLDMSLTTSRHDFHDFCYGMLTTMAFAEVANRTENQQYGSGYGLEVPCVYRLYGPKVYIQRINVLVSSLGRAGLL